MRVLSAKFGPFIVRSFFWQDFLNLPQISMNEQLGSACSLCGRLRFAESNPTPRLIIATPG